MGRSGIWGPSLELGTPELKQYEELRTISRIRDARIKATRRIRDARIKATRRIRDARIKVIRRIRNHLEI